MAKKTVKEDINIEEIKPLEVEEVTTVETVPTAEVKAEETATVVKQEATKQKYDIGAIVFITNDASADLNGFKLFAQYKKYTYTVESYDAETDVYTLRRLNLKLRLNSQYIVAPSERAHDPLNRKQY